MAPNVRFARDITQGRSGPDVIAHKRAISRARPDFYPWHNFSPYAGEFFMEAVVRWKKSRGLGRVAKIGQIAHEVLERTHAKHKPDEWAFDPYAVKIANDYYDKITKTPEERVRERIVAAAAYWYSKRWNISYSQYRPFSLGHVPWYPSRWDCSGFVTACHYAGGAIDPNGRGYDHLGYTGTLLNRGERVASASRLKPGDLIFYGFTYRSSPAFPYGSPTHVALYAGNGMVYSMGSYPMKFTNYNYRRDLNQFRHYRVI